MQEETQTKLTICFYCKLPIKPEQRPSVLMNGTELGSCRNLAEHFVAARLG